MYGRLAQDRKIGVGFFVAFVPEVFQAKGSFNLLRQY
jgi:hypothetical protein